MLELEARICLRTSESGGMGRPGFRGMRPSFSVGELITSQVSRLDGGDQIPLGTTHDVLVRLPYGDEFGYADRIHEGMAFTLNQGRQVIGEGVVTRIVGKTPGGIAAD
jgi:hypothetical protein